MRLSLPLSFEIVATDISRDDNGGARRAGRGGGWDNKGSGENSIRGVGSLMVSWSGGMRDSI